MSPGLLLGSPDQVELLTINSANANGHDKNAIHQHGPAPDKCENLAEIWENTVLNQPI